MRKHEGDTRVRKHSRMERFPPPDHATEQAIVQIGHRRFETGVDRGRVICLTRDEKAELHVRIGAGHVGLERGVLRRRGRKGKGPVSCRAADRPPSRARSQAGRSTAPNGDAARGAGKTRPPILRSFLRCVIFRKGSCQKSGDFHQLGKRSREERGSSRKPWCR